MKIKITITIEYETDTKYYPIGATSEKMLKIDLKNARKDIHSFLDIFPYQITGEIIK